MKRGKETSLVSLSVAVRQVPLKWTVSFTSLKCYARISAKYYWKLQHNYNLWVFASLSSANGLLCFLDCCGFYEYILK